MGVFWHEVTPHAPTMVHFLVGFGATHCRLWFVTLLNDRMMPSQDVTWGTLKSYIFVRRISSNWPNISGISKLVKHVQFDKIYRSIEQNWSGVGDHTVRDAGYDMTYIIDMRLEQTLQKSKVNHPHDAFSFVKKSICVLSREKRRCLDAMWKNILVPKFPLPI